MLSQEQTQPPHGTMGDLTSVLQSHQRALDIRLKLFDEEYSSTADSYHSLGEIQHTLGYDTSAVQSYKRALDIRRKLFGEEHSSTADSYHSLGEIQHTLGHDTSAVQSYKRALDIRRKLFGEEHSSTADSYHSLGKTQHALGDYTSAFHSHQRALDIRRKLFGEEHSSTADSYHSLGKIQHALGDYTSAFQSHQRALDIRRKLFGENHSSTADSYHSLGEIQHALGDYTSALHSHKRVLDIRRNLFGENHSSTADSYHSLGEIQHAIGGYTWARQSHQSHQCALNIRRKLFGEEHSITADSYHSLGKIKHALGDYTSALHSHQRALDFRRKLFGVEHPITADSYHSLGETHHALGDYNSALQSHQRALHIRLKLFGVEHSITADSYHSLGKMQHALGDCTSACQSHQRALHIRLKLFGEDHPSTADSYHALSETQHALGDMASARQSQQRAQEISQRSIVEHQTRTAESFKSLGEIQHGLGDFPSAPQSHHRFGENHSSNADSYHYIEATQQEIGGSTSATLSSEGTQYSEYHLDNALKGTQPEVGELTSVPSEILSKGPKTIEIYNKALKDGKTFIKRVPVMFIGQTRTGKTSLKKSLKGETFDPVEPSTQGIETSDPSHFKVSREVWSTGKKENEIDSNVALSFEHHAARFISTQLKEEKANLLDVDKPSTSSRTEECKQSTYSSFTKEKSTNPSLFVPVEFEEKDDADVLVPPPSETQLPEPQLLGRQSLQPQLPEDIAELVENLLQKVETDEDEEDVYSILWDFGGQSVYYTTHPIFLTEKAIYILVCDLSQNPYDKANPPVRKGLYKSTVDRFFSKTNLDYLEFWMSSIYSLVNPDAICQEGSEHSTTRLPPVFLVCTHADKPYCSINSPRELALEIFGFLQEKIYSSHLHEDVFVVDNTKSGSGQECSEVGCLKEKLREVAQNLPQMKEAIPIRWLKYERALKEMCKEGFKWIPLNQAREVALGVCQIADEDEFQTLLSFLHDQRTLIHFSESPELNQMVILDPQWLIDVFKKVITVKPYGPEEKTFTELWLKLEKTGILDAELLDHMWNPLFDNRETRESLIAIMERFSLLCPWPSSDDSAQYLVPSMLTSPPTDEVLNHRNSARLPSLFIKFEAGRVAPGLFSRLVLQFFHWSNEKWKNHTTPELFENFALFHICPVEGISVKLLCHPSSIEVIVNSESVLQVDGDLDNGNFDVIVTTARAIRRHLGLILQCMRNEFFWLRNMKFKMCVCCPECSPRGSVDYCRTHHVDGCTQDECLHFWTESELLSCQQQFVICPRPGLRGVPKIQINQFALWFAFEHGQQERNLADQQQTVAVLALPSPVVESIQLSSCQCDAKNVVVRLQECLELDPVSLAEPDIETKQMIRCLAKNARTENRLDVIKYLREITPAGTTGPLLQEDLDVRCIPFPQRKDLTFSLSGGEEWKLLAERLGFSPIEIRFLDKRVTNPADVVLSTLGNHRYLSVGEIYDALVKCELPALADIM